MERAVAAPQPIGMAELLAAVVAVAFGVLAAVALAGSVAGARGAGASPPLLVARVLADDGGCANAPRDPLAMRLGRTRTYPQPIDITLEPAPFSLEPRVTGDDAYRRSGQRLSGCETEELLAFYTSASPAFNHVLAWVLVSTLPCPSAVATPSGGDGAQRQCISISPVDAADGAPMDTRTFQLPQ